MTGSAKDVQFLKVDISDARAVDAAFMASWPSTSFEPGNAEPEITVFHTAANIRFYERHPALLPRSAKVNVDGTQNIISAALSVGATILVQTSSGSVAVHSNRFWLWPWEKRPKYFVQVLNDDDALIPKRHEDFFSNYAATKHVGEGLVRKANGTPSAKGILKTGCIRPGNGVFGPGKSSFTPLKLEGAQRLMPGGDMLCGAYLVRKNNPSWIHNMIQNFVYVENCSIAHLCYEERLLELSNGGTNPDISGQAFTVSDPGAPQTYGDVYSVLETLDGETTFPSLSPTTMLLIAQILELIYLGRYFLGSSSSRFICTLSRIFPNITGDIVNLQPSLFNLTQLHLIFDDSRARLPPEKGGLGYRGPFTTLEGLCKTVEEHQKSGGKGEKRSMSGGVSFGWGQVRAERAVEKAGERLGVTQVLN